ncbi:MAG TPA: tetratricopeptide repeat protein [Candidatus Omnitrophota bacterium]|nr:tetratricopeptide repeat protein [Candidatus Omnitrophota bacterium]
MPTTTARQKISLIFLGIFSTLVLLEIVLRIGGFIFTLQQDWRNRAAPGGRDEFRILCIGESTTALGGENSYPWQLENILNKSGSKQKFKVINKGLVAKTSADVLAQLNTDLDRYKPDLVISMVGVNDPYKIESMMKNRWGAKLNQCLQNLRLYHFFELLGGHISHRIQDTKETRKASSSFDLPQNSMDFEFSKEIDIEKDDPTRVIQQMTRLQRISVQLEDHLAQDPQARTDPQLQNKLEIARLRLLWFRVYLGTYYRMRGDFRQAQDYLLTAIQQDPHNYSPYLELGRMYEEQKNYGRALVFLQRARDLRPDSNLALLELGRCYDKLGRQEETFKFYKLLFEKNPSEFWVYPEIGTWFKTHNHLAQAEEVFLRAIEINPTDYFLYTELAAIYEAQGKNDQARISHAQAVTAHAKANGYLPVTIDNYNRIVDAVLSRGIKLICMQYPLRNIEPLKDILKNKEKIIFVENKTNFETALKNAEYSLYFSDNFGGDFGHCTRRGNELIARSAARAIVEAIKNSPQPH